MYLLLTHAYLIIDWHMLPRIPSSNINCIFMSVNNSDFILVFFKHACHADAGAETKCAGSS